MRPPCYDAPDLSKISEEIRVIGQVFDKEKRAEELVDYLDSSVDIIKARTADVPEKEKPRVLELGLSPQSRSSGGAGNVRGAIIAYYIEKIANAANAYTVTRYTSDTGVVSAENVLALDPDIIILPTSSGYHPPSELYSAPYYEEKACLCLLYSPKNFFSFPFVCRCFTLANIGLIPCFSRWSLNSLFQLPSS